MSKEGVYLEKEIMQSTVLEIRKQGTTKMRWIDLATSSPYLGRQRTDGDGIDLSMKRPALGSRMIKDKTRQDVQVDFYPP